LILRPLFFFLLFLPGESSAGITLLLILSEMNKVEIWHVVDVDLLSLIGTPSQTADRVTKAMQAILPPEDTPDVAQGTFISSHSWRKTGASALASFCSLFQVKRWGMWKTTSSCER
jgi:hypothetical protein